MESYKTGKSKSASHYYPPELLDTAICAPCLKFVLEHDKEAEELFDEIVEYLDLPGSQEIFSRLTEEMREGEKPD